MPQVHLVGWTRSRVFNGSGGQGSRLVVAGNKELFLTLLEQQLSARCSYSCPGGPRREGTGRNVDAVWGS